MKDRRVISVLELEKEFQRQTCYVLGEHLFRIDEKPKVVDIQYHEPQGEGDQHYCDIYLSDGIMKRVFRPESISFEFIDPVTLPFEV